MTDDRDWSWMHHLEPATPPVREERLWALVKGARRAEAVVRLTPAGPELRISIGGELFWSHVYRGGGVDFLPDAAKRLQFAALGWVAPGPREVL